MYAIRSYYARDAEGDVVKIADTLRVRGGVYFPGLVGEDGDQPPVTGIEIKMALVGVVQVGLLEDERHAKNALPKVNSDLPVGPDQRDMMDTLRLNLFHDCVIASYSIHYTKLYEGDRQAAVEKTKVSRPNLVVLDPASLGQDGIVT